MAHYGTLGDYRFSDTEEVASDIRGAKVYGPDNEQARLMTWFLIARPARLCMW